MLASLHWLPVVYRIQYKLGIITFKDLSTGQPTYLADLLYRRVAVRHTRSSTSDSLVVSSILKKMASRAAPTFWNNLPHDVREMTSINSFRTRLKTFYFKSAYCRQIGCFGAYGSLDVLAPKYKTIYLFIYPNTVRTTRFWTRCNLLSTPSFERNRSALQLSNRAPTIPQAIVLSTSRSRKGRTWRIARVWKLQALAMPFAWSANVSAVFSAVFFLSQFTDIYIYIYIYIYVYVYVYIYIYHVYIYCHCS